MEQDEVRDEALEKIAAKWREAAALGCVDALECALRDAWQASREAVIVELPPALAIDPDEDDEANIDAVHMVNGMQESCRAAIHSAGIRTR